MRRLPRPRRSGVAHVEHSRRVALRRQTALSALAMLSIVVISQAGGGERRAPGSTVAQPNPPNVPGVNATPTDTSVLVSSTAFSGDVGDTHDSTKWRIRRQSDASTVLEITVGDSLTAFRGAGLGYTVPLKTDTAYDVAANHHGAVSGQWSGYGAATNFTASSASPTVAFWSDWSTATGTSTQAVLDTDKALPWSQEKNNDATNNVVTAASTARTWPSGMTNVFEFTVLDAGDGGAGASGIRNVSRFDTPSVGDSIYWRWYFSLESQDFTWGAYNHPIQDGTAGGGADRHWMLRVRNLGSNTIWRPEFALNSNDETYGGGNNTDWDFGPNGSFSLSRDSVYMFEVGMVIVDADTHIPSIRIYDVAGTLLYDEDDWYRQTNQQQLSIRPNFVLSNLAGVTSMQLGANGYNGQDPANTHVWAYYGGVAICVNSRCGPWPIAGVEPS